MTEREFREDASPRSYAAVVMNEVSVVEGGETSSEKQNAKKGDSVTVNRRKPRNSLVRGTSTDISFGLRTRLSKQLKFHVSGFAKSVISEILKKHIEDNMGFSPTEVSDLREAAKNVPDFHLFRTKSTLVVIPAGKSDQFLDAQQ